MIHALHQFLIIKSPPLNPLEYFDLPIALRKGTRTCKFIYSIANFVSLDHLSSTFRFLIASLYSILVPKIVKEALHHPERSNAMLEELHAIEENHT